MGSEFKIVVEEIPGKPELGLAVLSGELHASDEPAMSKALGRETAAGRKTLILDFRGLEFICSAALSALLYASNDCKRKGGRVILVGVPNPIRSIMTMTNLIGVFLLCDTKDEAIKAAVAK